MCRFRSKLLDATKKCQIWKKCQMTEYIYITLSDLVFILLVPRRKYVHGRFQLPTRRQPHSVFGALFMSAPSVYFWTPRLSSGYPYSLTSVHELNAKLHIWTWPLTLWPWSWANFNISFNHVCKYHQYLTTRSWSTKESHSMLTYGRTDQWTDGRTDTHTALLIESLPVFLDAIENVFSKL